jgi:hypothetical protein
MNSKLDVLRGIQIPQILHLPPGVVSLDAATEAIELAESCGLILDDSQCITLQAGMGERADHKWAAFEVTDIEPRQSGKNDTIAVREMYGLFIAGDMLQIHTAHEAATANESFLRMEALISNNSELKAQVQRFRYGNGDHAVELKSGGRLQYKTRTGGGARGFAGASLLVYDEALFLAAKHVSASLATLARGKTRAHNPQAWMASSAALSTSTFMWTARKRALLGNGGVMYTGQPGTGGRFAYVEHTAEQVSIVDGKFQSNRLQLDPTDRRLWAMANPAMNHPEHGISEEFIENEQRLQSADLPGWMRERLGVFDPLEEDEEVDNGIPVADWNALVDTRSQLVGDVVIALDVNPDRTAAAFGIATRRADGLGHVEVVAARTGTGWVAAEAKALSTANNCPILLVPSAPAGGLTAELVKAGVPIEEVSAGDYQKACGALADAVQNRTIRHHGQPELVAAITGARKRVSGDSWAWSRINSTVDISPLVAVTLAHGAIPTPQADYRLVDLDDYVEDDD